MGARQFTDEAGRVWVAWNVAPDPRQQSASGPGWIVFETADAREKRRLTDYPEAWDRMPERELRALLASAGAARPSKLTRGLGLECDGRGQSHATTTVAQPVRATLSALPESTGAAAPCDRIVRSFRYPGGRLWSACVVKRPEGGGPPLLRFSAGARHLELHEWPRDWADYTEHRLVALVRSIPRPRPPAAPPPASPHRRHDDPRV